MELFNWVIMAMATLPRDLKMSYDYAETMSRMNYWWWLDYKVHELFDQVTSEHRYKTAFRVGYETWSFHMVQQYSRQVANYFHAAGLQRGDVVALAGVEGPRAVGLWLGLSRLGVVTAILPSNLPPATVVQAATSVYSKAIICNSDLAQSLQTETLPDYMIILSVEPTKDKSIKNLKNELADASSKRLKKGKASMDDKLFYLFSTDTLTPLPVTNYRYVFIATTLRKTLDLKDDDVLYSPLPQFQPEGSIVATGQAVIFGNTVVSKGEFTPHTYFKNCDHYSATVALYDEDVVNKLLALPPSTVDSKHKVRLVVGKGLRNPQTWAQFKDRFKVDQIGEYYGSVDSENYNMVNSYNKAGAVGFFPWFAFPLYQINLVAYDPNTGDEIRDKNGLCVPPGHGKPGILIDKLPEDFERTGTKFSKNKKVIKDVFKKGDTYINTGDILKKDDRGYFFLVDTIDDIKRREGHAQNSESFSQTQTTSEPTESVKEAQTKPEVMEETNGDEPSNQLNRQPIDEDDNKRSTHNDQSPVEQPDELQTKAEPIVPPTPEVEPKADLQSPANYFELEKEFEKAEKAVRESQSTKKLSNDKKLELYGLYKQATMGKVTTSKPLFNLNDQSFQWEAWKSKENMTKEEAMEAYIKMAESLRLYKKA